jgi:hypothetical protein
VVEILNKIDIKKVSLGFVTHEMFELYYMCSIKGSVRRLQVFL